MGEGGLKEARGFWFAYKGIAFIVQVMSAVVVLAIGIWPEREKEGWYEEVSIGFAALLVIVVWAVSQGLHFQTPNAEARKVKGKDRKPSPGCRQPVPILDHLKVRLLSTEDSATTGENVPVMWSRAQGFNSRNAPILCLLLTVANMVTSVAASPAMAGVAAQKQNERWAAIVGVVVAMAGVALAIVSATWWRKQRVPDLEGQHQGQAILDLTQVLQTNFFLPNLSKINARRFEDMLPQAIPE